MDIRSRRWIAALGGGAAAVLIAVTAGLAVGHGGRDAVRIRGGSRPTLADATTTTSEPSTTTVAPTAISTAEPQLPSGTAPTTPASSPWHVSATSGLTNLAPVTMTETGIPPASYYVGQCPAGRAPSLDTCVLNHVVTVTDGTFSGTVHVFWWLREGRIDCGRAPGTCVVGVMNSRTGATVASFAISFDPARRPKVTVTPHDSLTDGQSVSVRGVDVGEGSVQIEECIVPEYLACTYGHVPSRPDGTFSTAMTVSRRIESFGRAGPESSVCGVDGDCGIVVYITPKGFDSKRILINPDQPVGIAFAPEPATTQTTAPPNSGG